MSRSKDTVEYSKQKSRRGYSTIPAYDPNDGGEWDVLLSDLKMDWAAKMTGRAKELAYNVPPTLRNPTAIFETPAEDRESRDLIYVGHPAYRYKWDTGATWTAGRDEVFVVTVSQERIIDHWDWTDADPNDKKLPRNHRDMVRVL